MSNILSQFIIVFVLSIYGSCLGATNDNLFLIELSSEKTAQRASFSNLVEEDLSFFENVFAIIRKDIFRQLDNSAQISLEFDNSSNLFYAPNELGKGSDLTHIGNRVTISHVASFNVDVPSGIPVAGSTELLKAYNTYKYEEEIDFRPNACQLSASTTQNSCIDNNNGTFTTNFDVNISWIDEPVEDIQVLVNGMVVQTIISGSISPQTVAIALNADGIGQDTIITTFVTTTTCADTILIKSPNPCPNDVATCSNTSGCLGGNAFEDFNADGTDDTNETGIQGVQVVVYDCQNNAIDTIWTDNDGEWQLCGLTDGAAYRVEFILPESIACWASPTHAGNDNGTDVQFLTAPACTKFGLSNPKDYCEADPFVIIPCYSIGAYDGATSGEAAIVKLRERADGHDFTGTTKTAGYEAEILANHNDVGAVYGVAWQPTQKRYYLSAFHKRYVGFGPDGPDAIYQYDLAGTKTGTINLDAILTATNSAGTDVHDFTPAGGADPHPGEVYDLGIGDISFDGVGKRSFGDMEMSDDDSTLYVINLFDKKIVTIQQT